MRKTDSFGRQCVPRTHRARLHLLVFCLTFASGGCGELGNERHHGIPCDQDHVGVEMCLDDHSYVTCRRHEGYFVERVYYEWGETDCETTLDGPYCILRFTARGWEELSCGEDMADIPEHGVPYGGTRR